MDINLRLVCIIVLLQILCHQNNVFVSGYKLTSPPNFINGIFGKIYSLPISRTSSFLLEYNYDSTNMTKGIRLDVDCPNARKDFPIMIVVKQQLGIVSFQIPDELSKLTTNNYPMSHTLCPDHDYWDTTNIKDLQQTFAVDISSVNPVTRLVSVSAQFEDDFLLEVDKTIDTYGSPSQSQYFQVLFPNDDTDHLFVQVTSEDSICSYVSIQKAKCPVYDQSRNLKYEGSFQSMTNRASMVALKNDYENGFFVVLVVETDDDSCISQTGVTLSNPSNRTKHFNVKVTRMVTKNDYNTAVYLTVGFFSFFYLIAMILCVVTYCFFRKTDENKLLKLRAQENSPACMALVESNNVNVEVNSEPNPPNDTNRQRHSVHVDRLATKGTKRLTKKSTAFFWAVFIIAVLYAVPVIQLVLSYQKTFINSGNQDICYYNFLCAYPNGLFNDFNHVYSNIGYVLLGLLFCIVVFTREMKVKKLAEKFPRLSEDYGVPHHFGFFYAMGSALIMEGVLSGCYHICPSQTNFQFDTSFMYMITGLCMLKIYHTRHPDINANVIDAAVFYACVILLAVLGVFIQHVAKWIVFFFIYLMVSLAVCIKVYHVGTFQWKVFILQRNVLIEGPRKLLKEYRRPKYKNRLILITVGFFINFALDIYGIVMQPRDFDTFLLAIFIMNLLLYLVYYIIMKNVKKENIHVFTWCLSGLALVSWLASLYFFVSHKYMSTSSSPAMSREVNINCIMFHFYDYHDIWHFLSAIGMFFSFMTLLHLDDELSTRARTTISVF